MGSNDRVASRRQAIALGFTAFAGLGIGYLARTPEAGRLYLQNLYLEKTPLSFGGGLSLLGSFQGTKGGQVWLRSIFSFGSNYVLCTVEDNPEGFIFPAATMGNVPLDPHSFFMYMYGSRVDKVEYGTASSKHSLPTGVRPVLVKIVGGPISQDGDYCVPQRITLVVGVNNTVIWRNIDASHHTVTEANRLFESGNVNPNETYAHSFAQPGVYSYVCDYHSWMRGSIIVKG